jgi:hypothetical protein
LPASLSAEQRAAALEASSRITNERTLEFGHPVVPRDGARRTRFLPIATHAGAAVPFTYHDGGAVFSGALHLRTPKPPLP